MVVSGKICVFKRLGNIIMVEKEEYLFPKLHTARYGQGHRSRPLFLPKYLKLESPDKRLMGKAQEKVYHSSNFPKNR
jgi:hypothetical protein